jgi:hypothetical protein
MAPESSFSTFSLIYSINRWDFLLNLLNTSFFIFQLIVRYFFSF